MNHQAFNVFWTTVNSQIAETESLILKNWASYLLYFLLYSLVEKKLTLYPKCIFKRSDSCKALIVLDCLKQANFRKLNKDFMFLQTDLCRVSVLLILYFYFDYRWERRTTEDKLWASEEAPGDGAGLQRWSCCAAGSEEQTEDMDASHQSHSGGHGGWEGGLDREGE